MRRAIAIAAATAALVAVLGAGAHASAQDDPERSALARSLFQEGVELARAERFEEAADRFRRAYEIRPAPAIAFNLASALTRLGRLVESTELLQQALRAPDLQPDLRSAVELQLREITPRVGRLTVPIDPGAHVVLALRDGDEVAREDVAVAEGAPVEVTLAIPERTEVPAEALRVSADPEPRDAPPQDDSGVWIGLGVGIGVALVAGAIVTGVVLAQPGAPAAIPGNTSPAVLEW
jgi:tetratricopeptide (TPR) repeat protein